MQATFPTRVGPYKEWECWYDLALSEYYKRKLRKAEWCNGRMDTSIMVCAPAIAKSPSSDGSYEDAKLDPGWQSFGEIM